MESLKSQNDFINGCYQTVRTVFKFEVPKLLRGPATLKL